MVKNRRVNQVVLIFMVLGISALFLKMIGQFLLAIFMAGLFSAMARPLYKKVLKKISGRETLASIIVLTGLVVLVFLPFTIFLGVIVGQAVEISQNVKPWVESFIQEPSILSEYLEGMPYYEQVLPYRDQIIEKSGSFVGSASQFLVSSFSSLTKGTVNIAFDIVVMLYVMFYFLIMGDKLLNKILFFLPLSNKDERRLLERFTSVTLATLKSTVIIGVLQGGICGLAFLVVGIHGVFFWGTVMAFMSIIPAVGTAIVWVPAVLVVLAQGQIWQGITLLVICGGIAGNLDNVLRPKLVGKDTQLHDLYILFGTLGGLAMFGVAGVILGPIIAALFVTIWEIYGEVFKEYLPEVR